MEKIEDGGLVTIAMGQDGSTLFRRWGATWIDFVVLGIGLVSLLFLGGFAGLIGRGEATSGAAIGFFLLLCIAFVLAYYIIPEGRWGRTVGKLVTGLKVVGQDGAPPGYGASTIRTLLRLIEVNPFLAGGLPAGFVVLISKQNRRLGDMAANTFVLCVRDIERFHRQTAAVFN